MNITNWKILNKNFNIFPPKSYSEYSYYYKILYDNKPLYIQTPKNILYSTPRQFNKSSMCLTIGFNDYSINKNTRNFIDTLLNIDTFIKMNSKLLSDLTKQGNSTPIYKSNIHFNNNKTIAFMDVNIPLISNVPSISVYDHHKKSQSVKYMKPFSEAIHILALTYIWYS